MKFKYCGLVVLFVFFFIIFSFHCVSACKDIVACGNTTSSEYNLLLKVRDPSRPGYQVLTIVPKGYAYNYHHPWNGENITFNVSHSYIGVATLGDTHPNIVKAGMCFTDAGLAFGDADAITHWKNPTKYAWDDFDWIRYACQTADNEEEAVHLLTKDAVDQLHATNVPENLFVVGPKKGYVIEADVMHYNVTEITDDVAVMSNYGKNLWEKSLFLRMIAPSFNATFQGNVQKGQVIRLGNNCVYGIKIIDIGTDFIEVKQVPIQFSKGNIIGRVFDLFSTTKIQLKNAEKIGFYRMRLQNITNEAASIFMCFEYYEWEEKMMEIIRPSIGNITISTMMQWSRLHDYDLDGLRGMCDDYEIYPYEGNMIYKIPKTRYELLSEGWFSANHPCSSIYVPIHICNTDIYDPYKTGDAAALSLNLLNVYGHGFLSEPFHEVEQVFINELSILEPLINDSFNEPDNISSLLTTADMGMQKQAYLTQQLWLNTSKNKKNDLLTPFLFKIWEGGFSETIENINVIYEKIQQFTEIEEIKKDLQNIAISIVDMKIRIIEQSSEGAFLLKDELNESKICFNQDNFTKGFSILQNILNKTNQQIISYEKNQIHIEKNLSLLELFFSPLIHLSYKNIYI